MLSFAPLTATPHADTNDSYERGRTALLRATLERDVAKVSQLLAAGFNANVKLDGGQTPLHLGLDLDVVRLLIDHGATVDAVDATMYVLVVFPFCFFNTPNDLGRRRCSIIVLLKMMALLIALNFFASRAPT